MYSSPAAELHLDPTSAGYERVKSNLPYYGDNMARRDLESLARPSAQAGKVTPVTDALAAIEEILQSSL